MTGLITLTPPPAGDAVISAAAQVTLTVGGGTQPPISVDLTSGSGTFPCAAGDLYSVFATATNANGVSLPSVTLTGVCNVAGGGGSGPVPSAPTITVSFTDP